MSEILSAWIRALVGAGMFCAVAMALCPKGKARKVLSLACGCVMLSALLSLVASIDLADYSRAAARYTQAAREAAEGAQETAKTLERSVIERECETYISDRAAAMGVTPGGVNVTARWSEEGFWFPWECRLEAERSAALADAIEAELGIPPERQSWGVEQ